MFEESEVFEGMRAAVGARIGLSEPISLGDLEAIYVGCVFGQAWNPDKVRRSNMCTLYLQ